VRVVGGGDGRAAGGDRCQRAAGGVGVRGSVGRGELVTGVVGVGLGADLGAVAGVVVPVGHGRGAVVPRGQAVGLVVGVGVGGRAGHPGRRLGGEVRVRVVSVADAGDRASAARLERVGGQAVTRVVVHQPGVGHEPVGDLRQLVHRVVVVDRDGAEVDA